MNQGDFDIALKKAIFEAIGSITLLPGGEIDLPYWNNKQRRILLMLIEEGIVTNEELSNVIDTLLKKLGRECYQGHVTGTYTDHTVSPEAFAYALLQGEFSAEEQARIKFDNETKEFFIRNYADGIQKSILKQLVTEVENPWEVLAKDSGSLCKHACC